MPDFGKEINTLADFLRDFSQHVVSGVGLLISVGRSKPSPQLPWAIMARIFLIYSHLI